MKCNDCGKEMERKEDLEFNQHEVSGWKCKCGEEIYDSEEVQKVLMLNKLKKKDIKAKLGRVRSNLILRLPKDVEETFGFEKGEEVQLVIEDDGVKVLPA